MSPTADHLLESLARNGVRFVLVGGAAAVLHGSPIVTQDVGIVPDQDPANLDRLHTWLQTHHAYARDLTERRLPISRETLDGTGQVLTVTDFGALDILCRLHDGRGFTDLLPVTERLINEDTIELNVLSLEAIVAIKSTTGRPRDLAQLPILRALLQQR